MITSASSVVRHTTTCNTPLPARQPSSRRRGFRMVPGDFFRVDIQQCAQIDEDGNVWWREKRASIMMLSRGLDNFPAAPTLNEAMAQVRKWKQEQDDES